MKRSDLDCSLGLQRITTNYYTSTKTLHNNIQQSVSIYVLQYYLITDRRKAMMKMEKERMRG